MITAGVYLTILIGLLILGLLAQVTGTSEQMGPSRPDRSSAPGGRPYDWEKDGV